MHVILANRTSFLRQTHVILLWLINLVSHAKCIEDQCMHNKLVHNPYRLQAFVGAPKLMPSLRGTLRKSSNKIALKRSKTINSLITSLLRGLTRNHNNTNGHQGAFRGRDVME